MLETNNSHDGLFRYATSQVQEIRIYLKKYFPKEFLAMVDMDSLKKEDISHVDEALEPYYTDSIYQVILKGEKETLIYISLLFEHKSYIPKFPHLQLLQYILNGLNQQAKEKGRKKLTLILPFVITHAERKWKVKPLWEYFNLPSRDFIKFIPNFEYLLTDLFQETDASIEEMAAGMLLSTFLLFKHRGDNEYLKTSSEKVFIYWKAYKDTVSGRMFTKAISRYIHTNYDINSAGLEQIIESVPEPIKSDIMMLKEQLLMEGKAIGEAKGKVIGETKKELEFILNLFMVYPKMTDEQIVRMVRTTPKRVAELRKKWGKLKTNFAKVQYLAISFPDWKAKEIAAFSNIPLSEIEKGWHKIKPEQN